jgi:hypothetical protein
MVGLFAHLTVLVLSLHDEIQSMAISPCFLHNAMKKKRSGLDDVIDSHSPRERQVDHLRVVVVGGALLQKQHQEGNTRHL